MNAQPTPAAAHLLPLVRLRARKGGVSWRLRARRGTLAAHRQPANAASGAFRKGDPLGHAVVVQRVHDVLTPCFKEGDAFTNAAWKALWKSGSGRGDLTQKLNLIPARARRWRRGGAQWCARGGCASRRACVSRARLRAQTGCEAAIVGTIGGREARLSCGSRPPRAPEWQKRCRSGCCCWDPIWSAETPPSRPRLTSTPTWRQSPTSCPGSTGTRSPRARLS